MVRSRRGRKKESGRNTVGLRPPEDGTLFSIKLGKRGLVGKLWPESTPHENNPRGAYLNRDGTADYLLGKKRYEWGFDFIEE